MFKCVTSKPDRGETRNTDFELQARNDDIHEQQAIILAAIGDNFESANASVMYQARNVLNARATKDDHEAEIKALEKDIKPEWRENWYDGLGYCGFTRS